jgi:hypothetical protein
MNRPRSKPVPPMLLENGATLPWYGKDPAKTCHPLGEFLLWAVERGLAPVHAPEVERIRFAPGAYVVNACDSKLTRRDFAPHAQDFIARAYQEYREYVGPSPGPMSAGTKGFLNRLLDGTLLPEVPAQPKTSDRFFPGQQVHHEDFGEGKILRPDARRDGTARYKVAFGPRERRGVPASELRLISDVWLEQTESGHVVERSISAMSRGESAYSEPAEGSEWPERTAVTHPRFGRGVVVSGDGRGPDAKLAILFDSGEKKTLLAKFVARAHQE